MAIAKFNPNKNIPSMTGKVILVTGGTAGLGQGAITKFAQHDPAHIFFTGRNSKSAETLIARVKKTSPKVSLTFIPCDLTSFASVQQAARTFKASSSRLDILMCNAGIMAVEAATTKDGYEVQFGTNHLSHALLTKLLLPTLLSTTADGNDVRIINMTSVAYQQAPKEGINFSTLKSTQEKLGSVIPGHKWSRYGQSKLANLLYTQELARRYPQITSVSVHPGIIMTGLFDNVSFGTKLPALVMSIGKKTSVEEGPNNQVWAATVEKSILRNGEYYEPMGKVGVRTTAAAKSVKLAGELWKWTQGELKTWE